VNILKTEKRVQVVAALVEGTSINAIVRMTGVAKHTILKLLEDLGCVCAAYHHRYIRNLRSHRIQCDEIWQFVGAKQKNATPERKAAGWGAMLGHGLRWMPTQNCVSHTWSVAVIQDGRRISPLTFANGWLGVHRSPRMPTNRT
jgi:hypothetical protein